jgi:hypothetical protein
MPSHIYQVRGRYKDAIRVNVAAARADEAFIRTAGDQGGGGGGRSGGGFWTQEEDGKQ